MKAYFYFISFTWKPNLGYFSGENVHFSDLFALEFTPGFCPSSGKIKRIQRTIYIQQSITWNYVDLMKAK